MKTPCFLRGFERGIQCYQTTHVSTYPKKATIPLNVLSYNILNLKAPLFKGVGGDPMLLNNPHFHLPYKKATIPQKKHSSPKGNIEVDRKALAV
jgi:hypothetical protein